MRFGRKEYLNQLVMTALVGRGSGGLCAIHLTSLIQLFFCVWGVGGSERRGEREGKRERKGEREIDVLWNNCSFSKHMKRMRK